MAKKILLEVTDEVYAQIKAEADADFRSIPALLRLKLRDNCGYGVHKSTTQSSTNQQTLTPTSPANQNSEPNQSDGDENIDWSFD